MHILLTNDDGIFAPGLVAMYKQLTTLGTVTVVAPSEAKSGAGHSISLVPLVSSRVDITGRFTAYSVEGSPADCVKLAVMELVKEPIDLVVSGINHGANAGINVYYSGTVAAAIEAAFFEIPSVALSAAYEEKTDLETAAEYGREVLEKLLPLTAGDIININIPPLAAGRPKGVKVVPQAIGGFDESYTVSRNNGRTEYQLTAGRHRDETTVPTDISALIEGFITVTALHFNMTDHKKNLRLKKIKW